MIPEPFLVTSPISPFYTSAVLENYPPVRHAFSCQLVKTYLLLGEQFLFNCQISTEMSPFPSLSSDLVLKAPEPHNLSLKIPILGAEAVTVC